MKKFLGIFSLLALLLSISSCKKKQSVNLPLIEIIVPAENESFTLPATLTVKLHIISDEALSVVSFRIDNEDQVPLSVPVFIYPEADEFDFEVDLQIDYFDVAAHESTFLHVKAENSAGLTHDFMKLEFITPKLVSKGFYLITRPSVSQTSVQFFDTAFIATDFLSLTNDYIDAEVSGLDDLFLILTNTPDRLQAFHFPDGEIVWQAVADLPIPEMYSLNLTDERIYTATGNGQVLGYRTNNGQQQFISPLVFDSVPLQIGVCEDFVLAEYQSLVSPDRAWLVFYKETAGLVHKHASQLDVQAFYPSSIKNQTVAFGNIGQLGVIQYYDVESNDILISLNFATGSIGASCRMEDGFYLIAVGKDIWKFNETLQSAILLKQSEYDVIDLQYDLAFKRIYVASEYSLSVFNVSADTLITNFESSSPILGVRLHHGYPSK